MPDLKKIRARRQSMANQSSAGFGLKTTQDAMKAAPSGEFAGMASLTPPSSPTSTPAQAGSMNAAQPGVFNGNPANGYPSAEAGFNPRTGGPGMASLTPPPPPQAAAGAGTWNQGDYQAPTGGWGNFDMWGQGAQDAYLTNNKLPPGGLPTREGSLPGAYTPAKINDDGYSTDWGAMGLTDETPGTSAYDTAMSSALNDPSHGGGSININGIDGRSLGGYADLSGTIGMREAPGSDTQTGITQGGRAAPQMQDDAAMLAQLQGLLSGGGDLRAPNAFSGPGGASTVGQGALGMRDQMGFGGFGGGGGGGGGATPLSSQVTPGTGGYGSGDANPLATPGGTGVTSDPAKGFSTGGTPPELAGFAGADGNIDEAALMKSLGYGTDKWEFPDIETFEKLNINAPYDTDWSSFSVSGPNYVADSNIRRVIDKYKKATEAVAAMQTGVFSGRDREKVTAEYHTLKSALSMYGINFDPLSGLNAPPPGAGGGGGGGGGGNPPPGTQPPGTTPAFPTSQTSGPGSVNWTRDDFNTANTDVMDSAPFIVRVEANIVRMFPGRFAGASAQEQAAMYEIAAARANEDEQKANKQKGINLDQIAYEKTLRENNPFRSKSEDLAMEALNNPNPIDLGGIQNRTASDYSKGLDQSIQAASGSASRRGMSMGSQAGLAGNLTADNRADLSRTLGEQTTAYQMADRQSLYDALNAASGVNNNYLGGELHQLNRLSNSVRGAYDPAASGYAGAADTSANLEAMRLYEKMAKDSGKSSPLDYLNIFSSFAGAF